MHVFKLGGNRSSWKNPIQTRGEHAQLYTESTGSPDDQETNPGLNSVIKQPGAPLSSCLRHRRASFNNRGHTVVNMALDTCDILPGPY